MPFSTNQRLVLTNIKTNRVINSHEGSLTRGLNIPIIYSAFLVPSVLGFLFANWYYRQGWSVGWKTSQFFFAYQTLGFVKRGLIGTILHPFASLLDAKALLGISISFFLAFVSLFSRYFIDAARALKPSDQWLLLMLCALSPATFLHHGLDLGRFDVVGLLVTFASLAAISRGRWWLAGAASALALFAHEAYLLINFPLVIAFAFSIGRVDARWDHWIWLLLPSFLAAVTIAAAGLFEPGLHTLITYFSGNTDYLRATGGKVDDLALAVIVRNMRENVEGVIRIFWVTRAYLHLPVILLWGSLMARVYRDFYRVNGLQPRGLYYAAFSPLLLSLIAWDHYRWVALAATNALVVILIEITTLARQGRHPTLPRGWPMWLILSTAVMGPIANIKSFPFLFVLIRFITSGEISR
jgi:hypothetical protein